MLKIRIPALSDGKSIGSNVIIFSEISNGSGFAYETLMEMSL